MTDKPKYDEFNPPATVKQATEFGYLAARDVPGRGVCCLHKMAFTAGLMYGIRKWGYDGRYCFPTMLDAAAALAVWDGTADPPGPWIKHKATGNEYNNPKESNDKK